MMFARPETVEEAVALLSRDHWTIVAGGTDFYPGLQDQAVKVPMLDVSAIGGLRSIQLDGDAWRIGALATWTDLIRADLPLAFDSLKLAAREVGSVQIQNRATIVGNICNASPAADGVPPLLVLDADIELISSRAKRHVSLSEFIQGNRKTLRQADEIVTAILIPKEATTGTSHFEKLGARKYLVISIAMIAARIASNAEGVITDAAVAVGSCSEVASRLPELEQDLIGLSANMDVRASVEARHVADLSPIDDVRATAGYRRDAARELVTRTIDRCLCVRGRS